MAEINPVWSKEDHEAALWNDDIFWDLINLFVLEIGNINIGNFSFYEEQGVIRVLIVQNTTGNSVNYEFGDFHPK